jgi:hypothetical protein
MMILILSFSKNGEKISKVMNFLCCFDLLAKHSPCCENSSKKQIALIPRIVIKYKIKYKSHYKNIKTCSNFFGVIGEHVIQCIVSSIIVWECFKKWNAH